MPGVARPSGGVGAETAVPPAGAGAPTDEAPSAPARVHGRDGPGRVKRSAPAEVDTVAIEVGEAEMGDARRRAGRGGGAQALDAFALKQAIEVQDGRSLQASGSARMAAEAAERGGADPAVSQAPAGSQQVEAGDGRGLARVGGNA